MTDKYKIWDNEKAYFLTLTVVGWIDVFTRNPIEITSNKFFIEKLEYIHNNPVEELIVERPEDYFFSSARNYAGLSNPIDIVLEAVRQNSI